MRYYYVTFSDENNKLFYATITVENSHEFPFSHVIPMLKKNYHGDICILSYYKINKQQYDTISGCGHFSIIVDNNNNLH